MPCPQSAVEPTPVYTLRAPRSPAVASRRAARPAPCMPCLRQGTWAFNQPLSFDTSSVTAMNYMFYVRSCPALPSPPQVACTALVRRASGKQLAPK